MRDSRANLQCFYCCIQQSSHCREMLPMQCKTMLTECWHTARGGLVVNTGFRGRGFEPHSGRRVVSLNKTYLPPKSTGNTQEAVAPSQHD